MPASRLSDLDIARSAALKPLEGVAEMLGIGPHLLEPYGEHVAKIKLRAIEDLASRPVVEIEISRHVADCNSEAS